MMTLNAYSSYMSSATIVSAFCGVSRVSLAHRFIYVLEWCPLQC
jgi:NCS1 family nucleobase:cation symporter-1